MRAARPLATARTMTQKESTRVPLHDEAHVATQTRTFHTHDIRRHAANISGFAPGGNTRRDVAEDSPDVEPSASTTSSGAGPGPTSALRYSSIAEPAPCKPETRTTLRREHTITSRSIPPRNPGDTTTRRATLDGLGAAVDRRVKVLPGDVKGRASAAPSAGLEKRCEPWGARDYRRASCLGGPIQKAEASGGFGGALRSALAKRALAG